MKKHFLVTVSNHYTELTGVNFICRFFKELSEHQITLFHICRLDDISPSSTLLEMWENPDERLTGRPTIGAQKALEKASAMLSRTHMSVDQMITKTFSEHYGKIKDILNEASSGLYDAIILGKRASYTLQWFFERPADETAKSIIQDSSLTTPLWICPASEENRKNVLICLDGSESSYRAVDHVGFILKNQEQHSITLFHVESGGSTNPAELFKRAKTILNEHQLSTERINTLTSRGLSIPATILRQADKGNFAAIAVGLEGAGQGLLKQIKLAGSTTAALIEEIENIALWCCP